MITKEAVDQAREVITQYYKEQEEYKRKNSLCLLCGKYIGHPVTTVELCWCMDCLNEAMDAGEDENGNPIF